MKPETEAVVDEIMCQLNAMGPKPPKLRWWERLVAWIEKRRPVARGGVVDVGKGYRQSRIDLPASIPWYIRTIERVGKRTDKAVRILPRVMGNVVLVVCICGIATAAIWGVTSLFRDRYAIAVVSDFRWTYHVETNERHVNHDNDWRDDVRAGAFNLQCLSRIRRYSDCHPHPCVRASLRRGVRIRVCWDSCPIYDDHCEYDYAEWTNGREYTSTGMDHSPVRPEIGAAGQYACVSNNEVLYADHHASACSTDSVGFRVGFSANGEGPWHIEPGTRGEFDVYRLGDRWRVQYNHAGEFRPISRIGR